MSASESPTPASPAARPWLLPLAAGLAGVLLLAILLPHLFRERVPLGGQSAPTAAILPSAAPAEVVPTLPPGPTIAPAAATAAPEAAQGAQGAIEGDICAAPRDDNERAVCDAQRAAQSATTQQLARGDQVVQQAGQQAVQQAVPADAAVEAVELQTVEEAWAEQNGCSATSGGGRCNAQPIPEGSAGTTLTQDMLPPGWTLQEQPAETSGGGSGTISVDSLPPGARP